LIEAMLDLNCSNLLTRLIFEEIKRTFMEILQEPILRIPLLVEILWQKRVDLCCTQCQNILGGVIGNGANPTRWGIQVRLGVATIAMQYEYIKINFYSTLTIKGLTSHGEAKRPAFGKSAC
jgi:hypothetical protein